MMSKEGIFPQEKGSMESDPRKQGSQPTLKKIQNYIFNFGDLLGQGNFSKVYKAYNEITNEIVAIKIIELNSLKSKKLEELLFSEIDILKKLSHPNILKCHEVFTSNRNCYIITQLCNEGDLESKVKSKRAMREDEAEPYIRGIYKGIMYLSERGVIHRDIKVSNIFIHNGQSKIADFGFAKATKTKFKDINIGSPIYMSPEGLIDNIYGPKTDIWAFGVLIYELLHGTTPYSHCKSESQLKYNLSIPIGWNHLKPDLSTDIKEAILKCLEVQQPKRISASDLCNLAYFRPMAVSSPFKHRRDFSGFNYNFNNSSSISNLADHFVSRSQSDQIFQPDKYRTKTQNQTSYRRTGRELSTGFDYDKHKQKEPVRLVNKDSTNHLKIILEEDQSKRHTSSFTNTTSFQGVVPLSKVHSAGKTFAILSSQITFRECVNILHYCRLVFKHLIMMRDMSFGDENQTNIFKRWLSTFLKTLIKEIQDKRVICEGDNVAARERKLEEVTTEYIKKYSKELSLDLSKIRLQESAIINYQKIFNYFVSVQQLIDQLAQKDITNLSLLHLAHSMVVIVHSSRVLKKCYEEKNYRWAQKLREIEDFLGAKKQTLDYSSYQWYKTKYL